MDTSAAEREHGAVSNRKRKQGMEKRELFRQDRRTPHRVSVTVFAAVFGAFMAIGFTCENFAESSRSLLLAGAFASFALTFGLTAAALRLLVACRPALASFMASPHLSAPLRLLSRARKRHPLAVPMAAIAICWLPYLVAFFPGVVTYDSTYELFQALGSGAIPAGTPELLQDGAYTDHKPLTHVLLIGFLFRAGSALGSQTAGIFLVTLVQFLLMAFACAAVVSFLARLKVSDRLITGCLAFFCLFPFLPLYAVTVYNDCMALGFFVPWALCFAEVVRTRGAACRSVPFCAAMLLLAVAAALFKKPNMYIIVLCCLVLAIKYRKQALALVMQGISPVLVVGLLFPALVFPALNVIPGSKGEMLGTFLQQTAYFALKHDDEALDAADKQAIERVLDVDAAKESFNPSTFDPAKYYYNTQATAGDLASYFVVWLKQGLSDPGAYLYAFFAIQHQWIYPSTTFDFYNIDYEAQIEGVADRSGRHDIAESLNFAPPTALDERRILAEDVIVAVSEVPALNVLFTVALYATWLPLLMLFMLITRGKDATRRWIWAFIPALASMAVLFISPMMMSRYALPVVCLVPLLAGLASLDARADDSSLESCENAAKTAGA